MRLSHHEVVIALKKPFVSNTGTTTEVRQSIVELHWEGLLGHGTSRGATPAELDGCAPLLADASPYGMRAALERLQVTQATRAALDMALHDLLGKATGQPLHRLLGLDGLPMEPTALSIGACPDEELVQQARELADWPILKLKLTPEDDGSRAGVLRSVYGGRIRIDGNGSWTPDQALRVAEELDRHGVELLEQPVAPGALDDLQYVHERSTVPVFADEDCAGPEDVLRLRGRVSGINIKLLKCGGLARAHEMLLLARACGLRTMLGCKVESALGTTAMAQLAGLADHLDLDGPVGLLDDPFTGVRIDRGDLTLPEEPGIGATPVNQPRGED
ncbi:L-alanine-DL-glutamate epimerase-like enolase superfamily enzyme [Streptomyces brevispora]|uniref:Dipeptide epimerase n=1 Tax=Streptomyces brevispora TaxID=887462 RepID=A0A561UR89_9ACTN|nr:dipeptide epimerase [Streptomyces brevispora]TWG01839.1 L-alanine-DL-glutamate epimerase-like enolase superfamily enzyme [Streptomyces brevispora]